MTCTLGFWSLRSCSWVSTLDPASQECLTFILNHIGKYEDTKYVTIVSSLSKISLSNHDILVLAIIWNKKSDKCLSHFLTLVQPYWDWRGKYFVSCTIFLPQWINISADQPYIYLSLCTSTDVLDSISENLLQMTAAEPNQTRNLAQMFKTVYTRNFPCMLSLDSV